MLRPKLATLAPTSGVSAIARSLAFLEARIDGRGVWSDFRTRAGTSTDWVSAFVAYAAVHADAANASMNAALAALRAQQRANGGWAYNASVPTDCDSTSWALLALATVDPNDAAMTPGRDYILSHKVAGVGGFATYAADDGIEQVIGTQAEGWFAAHVCVTATALRALVATGENPDSAVVRGALDYLSRMRSHGGLWNGYWWPGPSYPTYQSLAAMKACGLADPMADSCARSLTSRQRSDGSWSVSDDAKSGSAFETAFALLALASCGVPHAATAMDRGLAWLAATQAPDGGWRSAPILAIPPPHVHDRASFTRWRVNGLGTGVIIADERRLFTTAAALLALSTAVTDRSARP